jgi:hypothetical protein
MPFITDPTGRVHDVPQDPSPDCDACNGYGFDIAEDGDCFPCFCTGWMTPPDEEPAVLDEEGP